MNEFEQIMLKHIPNGCINLKSYDAEKEAILSIMKEAYQKGAEDSTKDLTINFLTRRPFILRLLGFKPHKHIVTIKGDQFKWNSTHKHSIVESIEIGVKYVPFPTDYIKDFSNIQVIDTDGNTWPIGYPNPKHSVFPKD